MPDLVEVDSDSDDKEDDDDDDSNVITGVPINNTLNTRNVPQKYQATDHLLTLHQGTCRRHWQIGLLLILH